MRFKPGYSADENVIEKFEECTGIKLPKQYREFILTHGGGALSGMHTFRSDISGLETDVQLFYTYGSKRRDPTRIEGILIAFKGRIPEHFMPIATDSGGNKICINLKPPYDMWYYDLEDEGDFDEEGTVSLMFDSFDDFVKAVQPYPV